MKTKKERIIKLIPRYAILLAVIGIIASFVVGKKIDRSENVSGQGSSKSIDTVANIPEENLRIAVDEDVDSKALAKAEAIDIEQLAKVSLEDIDMFVTKEDKFDLIGRLELGKSNGEITGQAVAIAEMPVCQLKGMFVANVDECMNIRIAPSTDAEVVGRLYRGSGGYVIERGDEWAYVRSGNVTGYVSNSLVKFDEEAESLAWDIGSLTGTSTEDTLRMRKGPSVKKDIVCILNKGDQVKVIEYGEDGWSLVSRGRYEGYVCNDFIDFAVTVDNAMTLQEEADWKAAEEAKKRAAEEAARKKAAELAALRARLVTKCSFEEAVANAVYSGIDKDDAYLMACVIHCEAGGQPIEGKVAVANVILARYNNGNNSYGGSMEKVIYYRNAFSVATSGSLAKRLLEGPNEECIEAVKVALLGEKTIPDGYNNFCMNDLYNRLYSKKYPKHVVLGSHTFYSRS